MFICMDVKLNKYFRTPDAERIHHNKELLNWCNYGVEEFYSPLNLPYPSAYAACTNTRCSHSHANCS